MDSAEEITPPTNMVHLPQDPMDLVVLLPLSMELRQLLMDLVDLLQPQADLVMVLLPDIMLHLHQADLVVVLLQPLAGSVPVHLHHNTVHLHLQADLAGLPSVTTAVLQVPRDLAESLQTSMALLQLLVAMVLLQVRGDSELLHPTNMVHLQLLAVMAALFLPSMELLQKTVDLVALSPPNTMLL
jgi:hypothetical protein